MDNLQTNISQLRTSVEELEKRIKAISSQVTVNTQITATKACLEEIKDLLTVFQDSYNEHLNYCYLSESEHMQEYEQFKNDTVRNISSNTSRLNEHQFEYENLVNLVSTIEEKCSKLEQDCIDIENIANNTEIKCNDLDYKVSGYDLRLEELETASNTNTSKINTLETNYSNHDEKITTLENNYTSHDSKLTTLENNYNSHDSKLTTLENNYNSCDSKITTLENNYNSCDSKITTLENNYTSHDSKLTTLENNYNTHDTKLIDLENMCFDIQENNSLNSTRIQGCEEYQEKNNYAINDIRLDIMDTNRTNSELKTSLDELTETVNSNTTICNDLSFQVEDLYNNLDGGSGSSGSSSKEEYYIQNTNIKCSEVDTTISQLLIFSPDFQTADLELDITGYISSSYGNVILNISIGKDVYEKQIDLSSGNFSKNIKLKTMLYAGVNSCTITAKSESLDVYIYQTNFKAKGKGKDFALFGFEKILNVTPFDNYYYCFYKDEKGVVKYGKFSKDFENFNIEELQNIDLNLINENPLCFCVYPDTETIPHLLMSTRCKGLYICPKMDYNLKYGLMFDNISNSFFENVNILNYNAISCDAIGLGFSCGGFTHLIINNDNTAHIHATTTTGEIQQALTFNNEFIYDVANGTLVKNKNLTTSSPIPEYKGCVLTDIFGMNYYYPDVNSNYFVELGVGKNVSAAYQGNGDIHIYINDDCIVYKYILTKNENNEYTLNENPTKYFGFTKIEEGYDNCYIAHIFDTVKIINSVELEDKIVY